LSIVLQGNDRVEFPALGFSQDYVILIKSCEYFGNATKRGVRNGFFDTLFLVDSIGSRFRVVSVSKVRTLATSVGEVVDLLLGNPNWQIKVILKKDGELSLEAIKKLIIDSFKNEKAMWEEMVDFEDFRAHISVAPSITQVFELFASFNRG
jgi:hypothetical protein